MDEHGGLVLERVTVAPGRSIVLRGVDLHVAARTMTTLVGPSGAGKTTLLRAVAGLVPLTDGRIVLDGRDLDGVRTAKRRIGVVFQQPRLFPNLTVSENVSFGLRARGVDHDERRETARVLLDQMGLAGFADRSVRGLSGGEQQRVNLARALAIEPDLLLFDEPLSAVDPNRRAELRALIVDLHRSRPTTSLYITHDREEAAELGDQLGVMLDGSIVQCGPPRELFERPASAFVAGFFGAENIVSLTLAAELSGSTSEPDDGRCGVIRPEHVELGTTGVVGTVVVASYLGSHVRVELELALPGAPIVVARVRTDHAPSVGSRIRVAVAEPNVWRLPTGDVRAAEHA